MGSRPKITGNFLGFPASKSMSSLGGAKYEAEVSSAGESAEGAGPPGAVGGGGMPKGQAVATPSLHGSDKSGPDKSGSDKSGSDKSGSEKSAKLMAAARDGDRSAYGQIVTLYQDRLFNALLRMVGETEEARELTQETFTRGLEKIETFRGEAGPYTWLFRIGMNLAISNLRRNQRPRIFSLDAGPRRANGSPHGNARRENQAAALVDRITTSKTESPPEAAERSERHQIVLDALGRLDAEYRAVLIMRDVEGFDYQQMADVLALPLGTLKSRLFRARLALRDELGAYLADRKAKGK